MEVRSPTDTLHRNATSPISTHTHTYKMELFIRLTFQTPFYQFLLENSLSATANRSTNKLAWEGIVLWQNSFCLQWTHKTGMQKVGRTPTELWDETMWHVGRAGDLESEELALIIKNWYRIKQSYTEENTFSKAFEG